LLSFLCGLCALCGESSSAAAPVEPAGPAVDFNRQVRPILSENCFACHGPDASARKAGLRLDLREGAFGKGRSGKRTIVPGKPGESEMVARILAEEETERMPPVKSGKKLTREQADVLRRWIEQGAPWSEHWAFIPPRKPALPHVRNPGWARNPLDTFVLARLEKEGLSPSPEADRETLIRRLSLDLIGLPPTPAEVDAFLADPSPDAYQKVVDRLLASPRYGERMALPWLDGARYADSNGYQADYERFMWPWRDYVIDSFNANKPFDRFTVEQMAGDLLPGSTTEQKVATGFHRNHRINTEGGIIAEEWRVEVVADRVETTAAVWLGLTMNCTRCHDHKYDPITQKEFYRFFAFFNNVPESGVGAEQPINHPPVVRTPRWSDLSRLRELEERIRYAEEVVKEKEKKLADRLSAWERKAHTLKPGPVWTALTPSEATASGGAKLTTREGNIVEVAGANPPRDTYTIRSAVPSKRFSALRVEALPDQRQAGKGPGRSENGNFVLTRVSLEVGGKSVPLTRAAASFSQQGYPVSAALEGKEDKGWAIHPRVGQTHRATFAPAAPVEVPDGKVVVRLEFHSQFAGHQFGRFRLYVTDADHPFEPGELPGDIHAILQVPVEKRTPAQQNALLLYYREHHAGELTAADQAVKAARKARDDFQASFPTVMVLEEMPTPRDAFVLIRGQYDRRGDKVTAGLPAALPPLPKDAPLNRLGLAKWMVDPGHPLTSRVAVNRFWEKVFGAGLVRTSENFGVQGEPPSHPELLDWLAVEFVESGWDVKALHRLLVSSATYRQKSAVTPPLLEKDPENRLLSRGPRYRLQAEMVRDNALAITGLLVNTIGGPSVRPYQPRGVWDETNVYGNLRNYQHDKGPGLYRRSLYTIWKRTAAPPSMLLFDSPSRELCAVRRPRTNTPLQALALLNEVTFVEAARVLGERMLVEGGKTAEERITFAFRLALARKPSPEELRVAKAGLERRLERYRRDPESARKLLSIGDHPVDPKRDPAELAAYAMTAAVLLNLDETITRE
jgi:hypothetical protein